MNITIAAIGRLKTGPEREIASRLLTRSSALGRKLGLALSIREIAESRATGKPRRDQEASALLAAIPANAVIIALDETGSGLDSRAFAEKLAKLRDQGTTELVLAIGGADGHGATLLDRARFRLAFGPMTWPHQFVRLMLIEQIYRAFTILAGHPYHRD